MSYIIFFTVTTKLPKKYHIAPNTIVFGASSIKCATLAYKFDEINHADFI